MTQDAIVTRCLPNRMAEVVVTRSTACGSNCGNCESCIFQSEIKTLARNIIGAAPGQRVLIESKSSRIYGAAMLVYIMPIALVIFCYAIAYLLGAGEGLCVAASFLGLVIGALIIVMSQRRKKSKPITFDIIQINSSSGGSSTV